MEDGKDIGDFVRKNLITFWPGFAESENIAINHGPHKHKQIPWRKQVNPIKTDEYGRFPNFKDGKQYVRCITLIFHPSHHWIMWVELIKRYGVYGVSKVGFCLGLQHCLGRNVLYIYIYIYI